MVSASLRSTLWLVREPRLIMLSAVSSIGFDALLGLVGFDAAKLLTLPAGALTMGILLFIGRAWFGLAIAATALAVLRARRSAPFLVAVSVFQALSVLIVTLLPLVLVVLGAFFIAPGVPLLALIGMLLFVPGAILMAAYSQAGMIVLDRREGPFEALEASAFLTRGYRGEILGLVLLVSLTAVAAMWLDSQVRGFLAAYDLGPPIAALLHLALRVMLDLFGTCCFAALYFELDRVGLESVN
jgi:hypothetical protein